MVKCVRKRQIEEDQVSESPLINAVDETRGIFRVKMSLGPL